MTPAHQFELLSIAQIGIACCDVTRSVEFYRDRLGIRLLLETQNAAFFECGGIRLMIGPMEGEPGASSSIVYFKVENIREAAEALKSRGVEFTRDPHLVAKMPDHDLWMAFFRDPDGNTLALMAATTS